MKKILFIDDEKDLHPIVVSYFPKEEFRVICASDGLEGLQKCRNEEFDFVILDYKMPKLDGVRFYQQLRDLQERNKTEMTPVIFVSGFIEEIKEKNHKFEKCEFLNKPFTKEELFQKMDKTTVKVENKIVLNPGDVLFNQGDDADCMYYLVKGLLDSSRKTDQGTLHKIGQIKQGELVGEVAVLNKEKRLLTITAVERSELIAIPSEKVMSIVNGQPKWIKLMIENLSKRLRDTVKQIS
jgi:CheY-like chemotaxis protein